MSPLALRRKYIATAARRHPPAHPPPAAAARKAQAQPLQAPNRFESPTKKTTTTNRTVRLTLFKPGFEQETEKELAQAFKRPVRKFKEDTPFYPWLPLTTPLVNFHLNFKG